MSRAVSHLGSEQACEPIWTDNFGYFFATSYRANASPKYRAIGFSR